MFNNDRIKEALEISIIDILEKIGAKKYSERKYFSPFRNEKTASFVVYPKSNTYFDFGSGDRGDVISLVKKVYMLPFSECIEYILNNNFTPIAQVDKEYKSEPKIIIHNTRKLESPSLIKYANGRCISKEILIKYCEESTFYHGEIAISFKMNSGGYENRNSRSKLSSGAKDITTIQGTDKKTLCLFEGFFDFLTFAEIKKIKSQQMPDCLVLNGSAFIKKFLSKNLQYENVNIYFDLDNTGKKITDMVVEKYPHAIDFSVYYKGYNDLNAFWINYNKL